MVLFTSFKKQSQQYGIPWWQLPDCLLIFMALVNIFVMIVTYNWYSAFEDDIRYVIAFVSAEAVLVIIIGNMIVETAKKIISINRLRKEFVEISSHQLRSPLSIIKWYVEILLKNKKGNLNEKQVEFLSIIDDANSRMLSIVGDLLNLSNLESGKVNVSRERFNLVKSIERVMQDNRVYARLKDVEVFFDSNRKNVFVLGDPDKILIALENIINNSIKYTANGGEVRIYIKSEDDQFICQIKDNGMGIKEEDRQGMFQKFYRAKNSKKIGITGTGLGLYVSKALVEQMGGKIWFDSQEGKGTSFFISLPKGKKLK